MVTETIKQNLKNSINVTEKEDRLYDLTYVKIDSDYILATIQRNSIYFYVLDKTNGKVSKLKKKTIYLDVFSKFYTQ